MAQDIRNLAPRTPAPGPVPGVEPPPPAASQDQRQIVPTLRGLVFVDGAARVQRAGIDDQRVDPTSLALLQDAKFLAQMQSYLGQPLTFARLSEISRAVIDQYRSKDHPLVDVVVPQQDVNNGVVQIAVTEFRAGQVRPEGNKWFSDELLRSKVRVRPGDPILASELAEDLAALNDNPFRRVDLIYQRSPEVGRTDLVLRTADRLPLRLYAGFDDSGTRALGINHVFAGFNYGNLFGLDQQLSYQATASDDLLFGNPALPGRPDDPRLLAHSATYSAPLPWHDRVTVYGLYAREVPRLPNTNNQVGTSEQLSLRYGHPFWRSDTQSNEVRIGYDFKRSNNNLEFNGSQINSASTQIDQFVLEYAGQRSDSLGSTGLTASLFASPGGFSHHNSDAIFNATRPDAIATYVYGLIGAERLTALPAGLTWSVRGSVQLASASLLSSEQFGLGGPTTVRGYDQYQVEGDNGWLLVDELRSPLWHLVSADTPDRLQLLTFFDVGHVRSRTPQISEPNHATLSSVGVGARYAVDRYLDVRFDYGWQLTRLSLNPGAPSRGHISVVLSY